MTFGAKLKQARQKAGLSQEQLAEKLSVSRSAIAKWETDKGMPDIGNLKAIASFLDVSVDYLLSDDSELSVQETKEAINFDEYKKYGKCRSKYDAVVLQKFSDADAIYPLFRRKKLSKIENLLEWTILPFFGVFEITDQMNNKDQYYIVEMNDRQYFVRVSKEFIFTNELVNKITKNKFELGNDRFVKASYSLTK